MYGVCVYTRKEGINRDNSRLGVFEMTAIRNTSLIPVALDSLLQTLRRVWYDKLRNGEISRARLHYVLARKAKTDS